MLEAVIGLPVFLLIVFGLFWLSTRINAQLSLTTAVGAGARLATTRATLATIPDVENFSAAGTVSPRLADGLLATGGISWETAENTYRGWIEQVFQGKSLRDLPKPYLYAMVFVHQAMRESQGRSIRYPCDPDADDGAGCLSCRFVNPDNGSIEDNQCTIYKNDDGSCIALQDRFGIQCRYRPPHLFGGPMAGIVRVLGLGKGFEPMTIQRRAIYNLPESLLQ